MEKSAHNRLFSFAGGRIVECDMMGALIIQFEILHASTNEKTLCKCPYAELLV